jgi:hypothetical protein
VRVKHIEDRKTASPVGFHLSLLVCNNEQDIYDRLVCPLGTDIVQVYCESTLTDFDIQHKEAHGSRYVSSHSSNESSSQRFLSLSGSKDQNWKISIHLASQQSP